MEALIPVIGLVLGVLLVNTVAARYAWPAPILLVVAGLAVSFVPGVPGYAVRPDLVLSVFLPPLLFGAAYESSAVALKKLLRPITQLAVALVLLTAFTVAFVLRLVLPGLPFAAALALGAIVAPPDAVAAVAVARRVGLPRRLVTVLEGESLFNDATSLVTLKVAIAAMGAGTLEWVPAVGEFAWASAGGLLVGAILGLVLSFVRRTATSPLTMTTLSLVAPFLAYVAGEEARASGVLAVVVTGLILGYRSPTEVPASIRLTETATWAALRFALEGVVFALIGLQLRAIVTSLDASRGQTILVAVAVLVAVTVSRPLWVLVIHGVSRIGSTDTGSTGVRGAAAVSWAGMRGVVSLAAAQTLPISTPYRSLLLVCTITVILGTLVVQGLSLPWVIRRLGIEADHRVDDLSERAEAHARANTAINEKVDELVGAGQLSDRQADLMRKWASLRDWRNWDDDEKARAFGERLNVLSDWRKSLLGIERSVIVEMRNAGDLTEEVLREMQHELDLEEALLDRRSKAIDGHLEELPGGDDDDRTGGSGDGAVDRNATVDHGASVDDADVSALLLDEQRAAGPVIGQQAPRATDRE